MIREKIQEKISDRRLNIIKGFKEYDEIKKSQEIELESGVAIVIKDNKVLLGLADTDDERDGKWCFPGGGIENKESCLNAAIRECYEEMGLVCKPLNQVTFIYPALPKVGFCVLTCDTEEVSYNEEFTDAKWFSLDKIPEDTLSINKDILNLLKGDGTDC